jgi:hypothetical protein
MASRRKGCTAAARPFQKSSGMQPLAFGKAQYVRWVPNANERHECRSESHFQKIKCSVNARTGEVLSVRARQPNHVTWQLATTVLEEERVRGERSIAEAMPIEISALNC